MGQNEVEIKTIELSEFSGGLNSNKLSSQVKDNEFADCQNVIWYDGSLQQVPGFVRHSAQIGGSGSTNSINGIFDFQMRDTTNFLMCMSDTTLYYWDVATSKWVAIQGVMGNFSDTLHSVVCVNDRAIGTNFSQEPWVWDGDVTGVPAAVKMSSFANGWTATTRAKYFATFNDRLVAAHCTILGVELPTAVMYSDRDSPTGWDEAEQYWSFDTDDGTVITGVRQLGEKLLVFKSNSIGYVTGYGDYSYTVARDWKKGVGAVSGHTVSTGYVTAEGVLREVVIFLSQEGLKAIDEGGNIYHLPVPDTGEEYKCYEHFDGLAKGSLNSAVGTFYRKRNWYFSFYRSSGGTYNDWGSIYDYNSNSLWPIKNISANCSAQVYNTTSGEYELFIGTTDGVILRLSESRKGVESLTELITNGSMEAAGAADTGTNPTGWTDLGTPTTTEKSTTSPYQGTHCCKVVTDAIDEGIYQDITTVVGERYRIYAYGNTAASSDCIIEKTDTDGTNAVEGTSLAASSGWSQMSVVFTATAILSRISFHSVADLTSTFYIDDASARNIEVDAYGTTKYYDFGDEGEMKFLRELVGFASATDTGGLTITVTYDKGAGTETSDTMSLSSAQLNWATEMDWDIDIDWDSYEELSDSFTADGLTQDSFRTIRFKIENNTGSSNFQFNRLLLAAKLLGRRWFTY